jgi:asparagine synthase (glutamine-hydrolysing)
MCGIGGFSGSFAPDLLGRMGAMLAHRGPDDAGEWHDSDAHVGLVHRRLSIIDLSLRAHQPMAADGGVTITYNGEIYNFRELRAELEAKGHRFHSESDTEVILRLYLQDGVAAFERLNGIFAFGLWDPRSGELLLVRDGLGVKPLYYASTSSGVVFASEIKALLACSEVPRRLDPVALEQHLTFLWSVAPRTVLRDVHKLPPGRVLVVNRGEVSREWTFSDLPYDGSRSDLTEQEATEQLRERLQDAVERQLVSDVPVGAMLSGGLDSSAVVAMARKADAGALTRCYSIGFADGADMDGSPSDMSYAAQVAKHLGVELCPITIGPDAISHFERMVYTLDEPQADPAPINAMLIAEQARKDGIPVLLTGTGGDDIFSGYRRHSALQLERYWGWAPSLLRSAGAAGARRLPTRWPVMRRAHRAFEHADLSAADRLLSYFTWTTSGLRGSLYGPALSEDLRGTDVLAPLRESLARIPAEREPLNQMLYLEAKHFLADHNLNYMDKAGMAYGVEVRVPFLDHDLVAFASQLPVNMKWRGREGKYLLKKAMEPMLPREVVYRPKTGFGAPLRRWIRNELREVVEDVLSPAAIGDRGLFDASGVRALIDADRAGRVDGAYAIFALMAVELWCRMFIDQPIIPTGPR